MTRSNWMKGALLLVPALLTAQTPPAAPGAPTDSNTAGPRAGQFSGLRFRAIGPAMASGRVGEVAIHPSDKSTWYLAVHSGGVWKTVNGGTTWSPIFDAQPSYSIGTIVIDPNNPLTIWVGSGENNSQRSVGWGDGVYKSTDGGRAWTNVGLKESFHIGRIVIDPRKSEVVYAAAMGSMWSPGGDRGVYKSSDGGKSWAQVLKPDNEWTGAYELALDPNNPDVLYATTYQRGRRQWGFIDGGPGSAVYRSSDAGATWNKINRGLPAEELGKIGLAVSPVDPSVLYAQVEAANRTGGFFRSRDGGQNWERMSTRTAGPPFYYHKIVADPKHLDRVYSVDVQMQVTEDGGRTFRSIQGRSMHVDNHAVWIDPDDTDHLLVGNDGGLYETRDRGGNWHFFGNLPITQFYKVSADNATPFYNLCGGTQDNNTLCGPSQTRNGHGTSNADWFVVVGGDGFQPRIDPTNPDIIYGESQHGELARYDRKTGERVGLQPQVEPGEPASRWHWDAPLLISPHANTRLYFASQRVYRSDDRGDSWRPVSGDLSRQLDRNKLELMGRVWGVDAVAKNSSTSLWGAVVSLSESPKQEGRLWAGTDDGLVNVTEDGGQNWRKLDSIAGVPRLAFVADVEASNHDPQVGYAVFNNHKQGDYKPYLFKSSDGGKSWTSIAGDLPAKSPVWTIAEDHVDPNLLFAGNELGAWFTLDGGKKWLKFSGVPTIQVRDIAIQQRENDLILATFGRGFYILHDFSPLRGATGTVAQRALLFPVKPARMFVPAQPMGGGPRGSQGDNLYTVANPSVGATITYYLRDALRTLRQRRQQAERAAVQRKAEVSFPAWDTLRAEEREEAPAVVLTISDEQGNMVRRLTGPVTAGFQRVTWDLRTHASTPVSAGGGGGGFGGGGGGGAAGGGGGEGGDSATTAGGAPLGGGPSGPMVVPGTYRVSMALSSNGGLTPVGEPQTFRAEPIGQGTLPAADRAANAAFHQQTARLQRALLGTTQSLTEAETRLGLLRRAIDQTPRAPATLAERGRALNGRLRDLRTELSGDEVIGSRNEPVPPSLQDRLQRVIGGTWNNSSAPTATARRGYEIASAGLTAFLPKFRAAMEELKRLEDDAEAAGAPWTPGRIPEWRP
jgi:photosystem II stability/assembly factor-like uncharacterized protein